MKSLLVSVGCIALVSCSPLKTSPNDEKHQLELTLHELQTNLDDVRHDLNCFQTELQILDGRIKYYETAIANLKQQDLEKQQGKIEQLIQQIHSLEKRCLSFEKSHEGELQELQQLTSHAHETVAALTQFKERIAELEEIAGAQNRRFEEVAKLKGHIEGLSKSTEGKIYKVRPGDSLEKIARLNKTTVDRIRKANNLQQDLIVVGQELFLP